MTSLDIYNASLKAANELTAFIKSKKYSGVEIAGALLINITSVENDGAAIEEELLVNLVKDFIGIREAMLAKKNG